MELALPEVFLCWRTAWVSFLFVFLNLTVFFALYGRVTFTLLAQRKVTKRKSTRMLALRVPCEARISWRGVNSGYALRQAHPETPAHPALLGKPERDYKFNIKFNIVEAASRRYRARSFN